MNAPLHRPTFYSQGGTADQEDYERTIYQSTHTVAGRRAPLPLRLDDAWIEAHAEWALREQGEFADVLRQV